MVSIRSPANMSPMLNGSRAEFVAYGSIRVREICSAIDHAIGRLRNVGALPLALYFEFALYQFFTNTLRTTIMSH